MFKAWKGNSRMTGRRSLNQQLLAACTDQFIGYDRIERLLRNGAAPLGSVRNSSGDLDNLYTLIVEYYVDNKTDVLSDEKRLSTITQLFSQYGMVVSKPEIPYDEDSISNPLWVLALYDGEDMLQTVKCLLDYGLDAGSAAECWCHTCNDLYFLTRSEDAAGQKPSAFWMKAYYDAVRQILLMASYPHILENDEGLKTEIWFTKNDYDVSRFRDWNRYDFEFDTVLENGAMAAYESVVAVKEKDTGKEVWRFSLAYQSAD